MQHTCNMHLLRIECVPETVLDVGNAMLKQKKQKSLLAWNFTVVGETGSSQENC